MDPGDLERMMRRVVREELQRFHVGGVMPRGVVERPRGAVGTDDEASENIRLVLEYTMRIDPDNTLPKEELRHLVRLKFPHIDL